MAKGRGDDPSLLRSDGGRRLNQEARRVGTGARDAARSLGRLLPKGGGRSVARKVAIKKAARKATKGTGGSRSKGGGGG